MQDAERGGFIFFTMAENVNDPSVQVQMPFLQLKRLNEALDAFNKAFFPSKLLFYPDNIRPWRWQDFELLLPYFLSSLLRAVAIQDNKTYSLRSIFRGALAPESVLNYKIKWDGYEVHFEAQKCGSCWSSTLITISNSLPRFLKKISDVAVVKSTILCKDDTEHDIHDGVFVCETGNALIDFRICFKSETNQDVALFFQIKHSEWVVENAKIAFPSISSWHQKCESALSSFIGSFRVVLVIVTNRKVDLPPNCTPTATSWPQNLLLISSEELATFLGPLAHRGLLASSDL